MLGARAEFAQSMVSLQWAREDVPSDCEICSAHYLSIRVLHVPFLYFVCACLYDGSNEMPPPSLVYLNA